MSRYTPLVFSAAQGSYGATGACIVLGRWDYAIAYAVAALALTAVSGRAS